MGEYELPKHEEAVMCQIAASRIGAQNADAY